MPLYLWMSKEQADFEAGKFRRVENSEKSGTHLGYALGFDEATGTVYQYTDATDRIDIPFKEKDVVLAGVILDPETFRVAVEWNGAMTKAGRNYCIQHGLDVCNEELSDAVSNKQGFYKPVPVVAAPSGQPPVTAAAVKPVP